MCSWLQMVLLKFLSWHCIRVVFSTLTKVDMVKNCYNCMLKRIAIRISPKMLSLSFDKRVELNIARGSSNDKFFPIANGKKKLFEDTYLFFAKLIFARVEKYHSGLGDLIYCLAKITICPLSYLPFEPYNQ